MDPEGASMDTPDIISRLKRLLAPSAYKYHALSGAEGPRSVEAHDSLWIDRKREAIKYSMIAMFVGVFLYLGARLV